MTTAQTQNLWRQHNALRRNSYRLWNKTWADYYLKQGRILLNNLTEPQVIFPEEEVSKLFVMMYIDVGTKFANVAFSSIKSFDVDLITKADPPPNYFGVWEAYMANYALTQGAQSIVSISATARARAIKIINDAVALSIEQGLGAVEAGKLIDKVVWNEWKIVSKFNAERIARTEIIAAQNEGAFAGAQSAGVPLQKVWLSSGSGDPRPTHLAANGQVRPMDEKFNIGGVMMSKPGDKSVGAEDIINCRCSVAFEPILNVPTRRPL